MNRKQRRQYRSSGKVKKLVATAQRHHDAGRLNKAVEGYKEILNIDPNEAAALTGLGILFHQNGDFQTAAGLLQKAATCDPKSWKAHYGYGIALADMGKHEAAIQSFRTSIELQPDEVLCQYDLGCSLYHSGKSAEAALCFERVVEAKPDNVAAHRNLGLALQQQGLLDRAINAWQQGLSLDPKDQPCRSNLLLGLNFSSRHTAEEIFEQHVEWGRLVSSDRSVADRRPICDASDQRRLKIGYVSPDFRKHSVAYFFEPLLARHDRAEVEVYCYAEVEKPDAVTERIQTLADHWYSTVGVTDDELAERIRADQVDILVDLAGHTKDTRLPVFALQPAPIQVTWLGYPNTSGLASMDYRLTDAICDPPGIADALMTEVPVRLPDGFLCYRPDDEAPNIVDPPGEDAGYITFGTFNNLMKISPDVVELWSALLVREPTARLLIKNFGMADEAVRHRLLASFEGRGIEQDRLILMSTASTTADHLSLYGKIDIALDTFPYNGTTTSCEALWMGVPVITLMGDRHAARVGASLLQRIGMTELVARDRDDYLRIAAGLTQDRQRLRQLRHQLRDRMRASPLMNETGFAKEIEAAFREMIKSKKDLVSPK